MLDGRNRLRACEELGIAPPTETYDGDPVAYVVSLNIARRHLNESQRGLVAAKLANMTRQSTLKQNQQKLTDGSIDPSVSAPEISQPEAAAMVQVSRPTVQRAAAVMKAAEAGLISQERVTAIEQGHATLNQVTQEVKYG